MQHVHNILNVYHLATAEEMDRGLRWYLQANEDAKRIGGKLDKAAGVIAALSPGLRWEVNIEAARRMIKGESLKGLGVRFSANIRKAEAIAKGAKPLSILRGNKVRAFYACILNPTNCSDVCVDGHAFSIWSGYRIPVDQTPKIGNPTYRQITTDYKEAAEVAGIKPHQIQAITWCVWRRLYVSNFQA